MMIFSFCSSSGFIESCSYEEWIISSTEKTILSKDKASLCRCLACFTSAIIVFSNEEIPQDCNWTRKISLMVSNSLVTTELGVSIGLFAINDFGCGSMRFGFTIAMLSISPLWLDRSDVWFKSQWLYVCLKKSAWSAAIWYSTWFCCLTAAEIELICDCCPATSTLMSLIAVTSG